MSLNASAKGPTQWRLAVARLALARSANRPDYQEWILALQQDWPALASLKPQPEKLDKLARFQAALAAAGEEPSTEATTPRKKADRRPKADDAAEAPSES